MPALSLPSEYIMKRINYGVAGDPYAIFRNTLRQEVFFRFRGWRKMRIRQDRCQPAIDLFRERVVLLIGPQTGFDMGNRKFIVKPRQCAKKCRRGVTLHNHKVRLYLGEHRMKASHGAGGNLRKSLPRPYDLKVKVGLY